jgi:hypothetical protein
MSGASAAKATEAADALLEWLNSKATFGTASYARVALAPGRPEDGFGATRPALGLDRTAGTAPDQLPVTPEHRPALGTGEIRPTMRLPTPDWLHHRLTISGPPAEVGRFRKASAGAGIIPWQLDLERMEEEYFHLLVAPEQRSISIAGARIFARQLRDAVQRRHDLAVTRVGRSQARPFDLHALVPVPTDILALGPGEPRALAWLWEHWGTSDALRHVAEETVRTTDVEITGNTETAFRVSFWSADWTPWRAFDDLKSVWPLLRFDIRPTYDPP